MPDSTASITVPQGRPPRFVDKVMVVTGAAQGIGAAVARQAAREGGLVVLADRSPLVAEVDQQIREMGGTSTHLTCDLELFSGAHEMVAHALREYGRIDVQINNVGGTIWRKPFEFYAEDEIEAEIRRSLLTTLWCCRAAIEPMLEQGSGVIVNVSSIATRSVNRVPYAAAKGGVNALTASLAFEVAHRGIRVVAAAPGGTDDPDRRIPRHPGTMTDQEREWHEQTVRQTIESTLVKRYSTPDEQAEAILFLASDHASYIHGSVVPVGGGDQG